ncbi:MAG: hypothetical protein QF805_24690, partial [Pirellulaceae bacterium]|nr:hypothetical protein [Pirellulaceae bacterium]
AAATSGSPVLKHGPMPPAAEEGVNALGSWNADARGGAGMERWLQRQRLVHPCSSTGLVPPAAEEGVNALGNNQPLARMDPAVICHS